MRQVNEPGSVFRMTCNRTGIVAVVSALLLAAWAPPAVAQDQEAKKPAAKDLRLFYQQNCAGCHGADGSARNAEGKKLSGRDLTDEGWLKRASDKSMAKAILNGKWFGWAMPGFGAALTADEAQRLVTEIIRTSEKGKAIVPAAVAADKL